MADVKNELGGETTTRSPETAPEPPATTIHEAQLATGPSGAVEYSMEIDEPTAVDRRRNGEMIFFTPDLIERFGSEDDRVALAAQTELERRSEEYSRSLGEIELELPQRCRELLDRYYLHDARVIDHTCPENGRSGSIGSAEPAAHSNGWQATAGAQGRGLSFWMVLELDTPPREVLVLQYRSVVIEGADTHQSLREDECHYLEWQTMKSN